MNSVPPKAGLRIAATADVHVREGAQSACPELFRRASALADVLVIAGDLTGHGLLTEARLLSKDIESSCGIPVVAVLGNHDFESGEQDDIVSLLRASGVVVLDGDSCEVQGVGFAGTKGFGGGFDPHALAAWGENMVKNFVREGEEHAERLAVALTKLSRQPRVVVLHYAPIRSTVLGESSEIFPFLGSSRLAEPIDRLGASYVFHGHAHHGAHEGSTVSGIPVLNVALPRMQEEAPEQPFALVTV